jgi:hypothetical protein
MRPILKAPGDDVLTPHPVGPTTPQVIARRLRESGLIVVDGLTSRADVLISGVRHVQQDVSADRETA